jgi:mannose-1-phosphate guanylyltransferase
VADHVVIMAGGSGTRFWPASRRARPKQFLAIGGAESLLRQTAERVASLVGWERIVVVTAAVHAAHARADLPELPPANVLVEPTGRNTAPCIGWASRVIGARDPDAVLAVLPADHYIADGEAFRRHLTAALEAARHSGRITLLGLVPTHPETGYGYIERGAAVASAGGLAVHDVVRFVEKPDRATALGYLAAGTYLWNSGMFVFPARAMDEALRAHLPALAEGLDRLLVDPSALDTVYPTLPAVSIDYGVMEKAAGIRVLPATFPWSDVGSWDAAYQVHAKDSADNVLLGEVVAFDSRRVYVDARSGRTVAVVGVEDLCVVDTPDAVLVTRAGHSQDVKHVVEHLGAHGKKELL